MSSWSTNFRFSRLNIAGPGLCGQGEVYRAWDGRLDRDVAIKILPEHLSGDPSALARFEREAKAVAALSHPNILAIHDFGRDGRTAYAVIELLEGETLRVKLHAGSIPARKAVEARSSKLPFQNPSTRSALVAPTR